MKSNNFFDNVFERTHQMTANIEQAALKMAGEKPLGAKPVDTREVVAVVRGLQPQEIDMLVQEFGEETMNNFLFDVYKSEQRLRTDTEEAA